MLKRRLRFIIMSLFSCIMVVFCHNDGTALPSLWQCSANAMAVQCQASKKVWHEWHTSDGGIRAEKLLFLFVPRSIHVVVVRYFLIDFLCLLGRYFLYELSGYSSPDASWLDDSVA